jgi:hypothetical protein
MLSGTTTITTRLKVKDAIKMEGFGLLIEIDIKG